MKQFDAVDVTVSGNSFHIFPFGAFKAANLSGELAQIAIPLIQIISAIPSGEGGNPLDTDLEKIAPSLAGAFDSISGDKVESLLKKLLTQSKNISYDDPETNQTVQLSEELVNELFCRDIMGIYKLAFEVIRVNFGGFFKSLGNLSGSVTEKIARVTTSSV